MPDGNSALQWSPAGSGLTDNPARTLERLCVRYVTRYGSPPEAGAGANTALVDGQSTDDKPRGYSHGQEQAAGYGGTTKLRSSPRATKHARL